jgi:tetratricopeptide (TPR) repeat protein
LTEALRVAAQEAPDDFTPAIALWLALHREERHEEAAAVMQRLYLRYPEKQFGSNVAVELQRQGRAEEATQLLSEWGRRAPGVAQQLLTAVNTAAREQPADVDARIERLFLLHGHRPELVCVVLESLLVLERFADVRALGSQSVHSDPLNSARVLFLYSVASTTEGKLEAARESLLAAIELGRPYGGESWTTQTFTSIARLDRLAGRSTDEAAHLERLAEASRRVGSQTAPAIALEARLVREGKAACPEVERLLAQAPGTSADLGRRRYLVRAALRFGCVDCAAVLREGSGLFEPSTESLLTFGRCAREARDYLGARRALTRASEATTGLRLMFESPFDRILAQLELARVAEEEGQVEEAARRYAGVLKWWDRSEVRVPELEQAREALRRLGAGSSKR